MLLEAHGNVLVLRMDCSTTLVLREKCGQSSRVGEKRKRISGGVKTVTLGALISLFLKVFKN